MEILKESCTVDDIHTASKEVLFYTWKAIEEGKEYPISIVMAIAAEMTLCGM